MRAGGGWSSRSGFLGGNGGISSRSKARLNPKVGDFEVQLFDQIRLFFDYLQIHRHRVRESEGEAHRYRTHPEIDQITVK